MFSQFNQIGPLLTMGLQTLPQRKGSSGVVVVGSAGVVAVLVSILAISTGLDHTMRGSGRDDVAILLSAGADDESESLVSHANYDTIASMREVAAGADGKSLASPEIVTVFPVKFNKSADEGNVTLRGIALQGLALHPSVRITDGRVFRPGLTEMLVGSGVASQFQGFAIGDPVRVGNSVWTVTGHFESDDIHDSEVLADVNTVQSATDMGSYYNALYVRLKSSDELQAFKDAIGSNPTLHLDVQSEARYFAAQSAGLSGGLTVVAYVIGVIMASGALFGAIHSLYISADVRKVEMATLRALGFSTSSVMLAFLIEALVLAFVGGCIGAALGWLLFNGHTASTMSGGLSQVVFHLQVPLRLLVLGVIWACAIGLLGALIPAIRSSRQPVAEALRG
jgi:putative ABC transport system permease protein